MSYDEFINNILETRGRFACGDEYHERHHIVPKCMGGTNDKDNLIDLFAREHFEAHRLLALENPSNNGLVYAWWCMCQCKGLSKKRYNVTADEYEEARIKRSELISGDNNPFYGKNHSDETKKKMRENRTNLYGSDNWSSKSILQYDTNGSFIKEWSCIKTAASELNIDRHMISGCLTGKYITTHDGKYMWFYKDGFAYDNVINNIERFKMSHKSEEFRNKMSEIRVGDKNPFYGKHHSEETKKKIRNAISGKNNPNYGKHLSKEQKEKISKAQSKKVMCIETGEIFNSMTDAANKIGVKMQNISSVCRGVSKTAGGYHWEFVERN